MSDPKKDKPLALSELTNDVAAVILGSVAARELLSKREAAFFVDERGDVQLIPVAELLLDALPEPMAIQEMAKQGLSDDTLELYLRGRDSRMKSRGIPREA
jgi:hypothetical protein